jgi:hypothetical protein
MSVTNRSQSNSLRAQSNNGWRFVRGAFALIALIGISFLFGFFVLAFLRSPRERHGNREQGAENRRVLVTQRPSNPMTPHAIPNVQRPMPLRD